MRAKILFVYAAPYFGSVWTVCRQVIEHIDRSRFEVHVAAHDRADGDVGLVEADAIVERLPLRVETPGLGVLSDAARVARTAARLAGYIRRHGIDLIHTNEDASSAVLGFALARLTGARLLVHHHTVSNGSSATRALMTALARGADCNVGVSRFVARTLLDDVGVAPTRVVAAFNGVDTTRFRPDVDGTAIRHEYGIGNGSVLVLMLARLVRHKRQDDFLRAFALASQPRPNMRALVVGWDDPNYSGAFASYRAELEDLARRLGIGHLVRFDRARPDAPQLHAAADIAVLPSVDEPFGLVVAEAMAAGKAVIGARSGGIPEIIVDGATGFLIRPRSPPEFAERLAQLADDSTLRAKLGAEGRRVVVARFSEQNVARRFEAIYSAMVEGRPLPRSN